MNDEQKKEQEVSPDLEALQKQCDEYLTGWKRALADYDNLKKDLSREKTAMRENAYAQAALALVPVLDNFDAAARFTPEGVDDKLKNWLQGILFVRNQLEDVMKGLGLEPFGTIGDLFDPNLHESGGEREVEDAKTGSIVEVIARGWKMSDRVVRPAKIIVRK